MTAKEAVLHLRARAKEQRAHDSRLRRRWNGTDITAVETLLAWLTDAQARRRG